MKGVIVCGGTVSDYKLMARYLEDADFVIAADSGADRLKCMGVTPDVLTGDFDSISEEDYAGLDATGIEILRFPVEKDMTDSELAIELALDRGCDEIILLGALGTRLDHSLSNIYLLKKLIDRGVRGMIADEHNEVYLTGSSITLKRDGDMKLSLLPLSGSVRGVTTYGLYYPLKDAVLETGSSLGVSNEFIEDTATVTITEGLLLVIKSRD